MSLPHPQACAKSPASHDYFSSWETKEVLAALLIPHRCGILPACSLVHAHIHFLSHCFLTILVPKVSQEAFSLPGVIFKEAGYQPLCCRFSENLSGRSHPLSPIPWQGFETESPTLLFPLLAPPWLHPSPHATVLYFCVTGSCLCLTFPFINLWCFIS